MDTSNNSNIRAKVLYDNYSLKREFNVGWGFSCLIDNRILFDTGESGKALLSNMKAMDIDVSDIEAVVISHDHWDHTGGLWELLKVRKGLPVYACSDFSADFREEVSDLKGNLIEINDLTEIFPGIYTTGAIAGTYRGNYLPEQAIALKTANGISLITGCSHPGVVTMLERLRDTLSEENIYMVFGGFHLLDKDKKAIRKVIKEFKKLGVQNVGPTHCSGRKTMKLFQKEYDKNFVPIKVGLELNL